jgi:hypothetical protein
MTSAATLKKKGGPITVATLITGVFVTIIYLSLHESNLLSHPSPYNASLYFYIAMNETIEKWAFQCNEALCFCLKV